MNLQDWKGCPRPQRKLLEGRYVRLEPFDAEKHSEELFEASQGRTKFMFDDTGSLEIFKQWMKEMEKSEEKIFFAVIDKRTGKVGGRQNFMRVDAAHGVLEVGGILRGPELSKTTASTEAIFLALCYAFDELGYRRMEWKCHHGNVASQKAARRFGFTHEGYFRQHMVMKGGSRDTHWFSIIDKEWPQLKKAYQMWLKEDNFDVNGEQKRKLEECMSTLCNK